MKIYTKTGDAGETGLFGNVRVSKDHLRICAYGTIDELNSVLGLARITLEELNSKVQRSEGRAIEKDLERIQNELFVLGAELATPAGQKLWAEGITEAAAQALESRMDEMEKLLSPLKNFILPGGTLASAHLHLARTVARRAERELVSLHRVEPQRPTLIQYVNRLSDYFFVAARFCNHLQSVQDVPWISKST